MKATRVAVLFGLLVITIGVNAVRGFRFYDIFEPRAARWPRRDTLSANPMFPNGDPEDAAVFHLISYLNKVGKRRR